MGTRVLDWNGLVRVADRRNPADRVVAVAGLPARVVPHRGTDIGFYVRTDSTSSDRLDHYWSLRREGELVLLRDLVDSGQVTIDDDDDPQRLGEWGALVADLTRGCFLSGCTAGAADIDLRGPVFDDRQRMHKACTGHWERIHSLIGEDDAAARQS